MLLLISYIHKFVVTINADNTEESQFCILKIMFLFSVSSCIILKLKDEKKTLMTLLFEIFSFINDDIVNNHFVQVYLVLFIQKYLCFHSEILELKLL